MSRALLVCSRNGADLGAVLSSVETLNRRLTPDNIDPAAAVVRQAEGLLLAALNPGRCLTLQDTSLCLGTMFEDHTAWFRPGERVPDGTFALFRSDPDSIELVSDITGSRTLWYAQTDDLFLASSSQRALVHMLGGFEPNRLAFAWFLSSGCLGPGQSWDPRIRALPANARLVLKRASWTLSCVAEAARFEAIPASRQMCEREMMDVLTGVFDSIDVERQRWIVPLSGGYDSRAILMFLKHRGAAESVTWGTSASLADPLSDAAVAQRVARELGTRHSFFPQDASGLAMDELFTRFLVAGEGRVDHFGGYLDGFAVWQSLFDSGVDGVLRGDVCWPHGGGAVATPACVRQNPSIQLLRLADYRNLPSPAELNLPGQELPHAYEPLPGERLSDYRERLYQEFRMPLVLSALNDLKAAYVEIANPFLSARFISLVRHLPRPLRADKRLFSELIRKRGPDVPFARRSATARLADYANQPPFRDFVCDELQSRYARGLLPAALLSRAVAGVSGAPGGDRKGAPVKPPAGPVRRVARRVRAAMEGPRPMRPPAMPPHVLALRCALISQMCRLLAEDSRATEAYD